MMSFTLAPRVGHDEDHVAVREAKGRVDGRGLGLA